MSGRYLDGVPSENLKKLFDEVCLMVPKGFAFISVGVDCVDESKGNGIVGSRIINEKHLKGRTYTVHHYLDHKIGITLTDTFIDPWEVDYWNIGTPKPRHQKTILKHKWSQIEKLDKTFDLSSLKYQFQVEGKIFTIMKETDNYVIIHSDKRIIRLIK